MNLRKKHIKVGIGAILIILLLAVILELIFEDGFFFVEKAYGNVFGTSIGVNKTEAFSFIKSIYSGILGSTFVAIIFYINEYYNEKQDCILEIIRESNRLLKIYSSFPFLVQSDDLYCKLKKSYYYEVLENRWKKEFNELLDKMECTVPKEIKDEVVEHNMKTRQKESFEIKERLENVLKANPELRKRRFCDEVVSVKQKLDDIVTEYDLYIDKTMECVQKLQEYSLENFKLLVDKYSCSYCYSKRKNLVRYFQREKKKLKISIHLRWMKKYHLE